MNFLEAGWLKALFFVYFHSFSQISSQDFIQSKTDSIKLQFLIWIIIWEFLGDFSKNYAGGRQMFKILEKWENIEFKMLGVVKN